MSTTTPMIRLVVASTRPVRVGDQLAEQIAPRLAAATGANVEVTDLAELDLPFLDEPRMPALGDYQQEHTKRWAQLIEGSDAVVFVSPQYNGGYPASLKNAIDFLYAEWDDKPGLLITYGGRGGGMAAEALRNVFAFVKMRMVEPPVAITLGQDDYGPDGRLVDAAAVVARNEPGLAAAGSALAAEMAAEVSES
ncbi:NADPH-dependent FMN reductase [Flexivirga meconopsidis]|uniref:NADPH-dependent FMN reductase n=1 Tax=Flexivirga meconopsidis TaxID=2977121 RepID=UPI00223F7A30|nr:NADPH-dependent FMN reductase [Flexivirga meconopsidis]